MRGTSERTNQNLLSKTSPSQKKRFFNQLSRRLSLLGWTLSLFTMLVRYEEISKHFQGVANLRGLGKVNGLWRIEKLPPEKTVLYPTPHQFSRDGYCAARRQSFSWDRAKKSHATPQLMSAAYVHQELQRSLGYDAFFFFSFIYSTNLTISSFNICINISFGY